jgi:hypothetical protein
MWYKVIDGNLYDGMELVNADYRITPETPRDQIIDGWQWFDTEEEARVHFGLPEKPQDTYTI